MQNELTDSGFNALGEWPKVNASVVKDRVFAIMGKHGAFVYDVCRINRGTPEANTLRALAVDIREIKQRPSLAEYIAPLLALYDDVKAIVIASGLTPWNYEESDRILSL